MSIGENFPSEQENNQNPTTPEREDLQKVTRLIRSLQQEAEQPMGNDPFIRAFCIATIPELMEGGSLRPHMEEIFAFRRQKRSYFPDVYAMRMLMRAVEKQALGRLPRDSYPRFFDTDSMWTRDLYRGELDYIELSKDMSLRNIQSNIPERYKAFKLITHMLQDRLGDNPTIVDVGDSINLGLKKWKLVKDYPFKHTRVVTPSHGERILGEEFNEDPAATEKINYLLGLNSIMGRSIGFDIIPIKPADEDSNKWVMACSFRPRELLTDHDRVKEYSELSSLEAPDVVSFPEIVDVRDKESLAQIRAELPSGKANLITCSTVFHQLTSKQISEALDNLIELCDKNTLITMNDFVMADPKAANGLKFFHQNRWVHPYTFRTLIIDPTKPNSPPKEIFRSLSSRFEEIWLTKYGRGLLDQV